MVLFAFLFSVSINAQNIKNNKIISKEIEAVNKKYANSFTSGDAAGMVSCYSKDATFLPPNNEAVSGRDSIKKIFLKFISLGKVKFSSKTLNLIIKRGMVVELGNYILSVTPNGKKTNTDTGKYLIVWKQTNKSKWKMFYDMYNSNLTN